VLGLLASFWLILSAAPAWAAVQMTFYTKELGGSFPHTFVILDGTLDRSGERIAEDYGFSAKAITPAILWGKVGGKVISDHDKGYVEGSDRHFTVTLTDEEYDRVMATVERWRTAKQPSYDLDKANCIHFVAELAAAIGMEAAPRKGLMRKPRSFVEAVTLANKDWLSARGATIHRLKEPERKRKAA
jgi:acid stress-induced BolA-like protein IbaG/YrbA